MSSIRFIIPILLTQIFLNYKRILLDNFMKNNRSRKVEVKFYQS